MYVVVQSSSHVQLFATAACQAPLSSPFSQSLVKFMSSQRCHPTISSCCPHLLCLQPFPVSGSFPMSWLFASGDQSIGASASTVFSEYSWLISFRIDWFDLLEVQETLKSIEQIKLFSNMKCLFLIIVYLQYWSEAYISDSVLLQINYTIFKVNKRMARFYYTICPCTLFYT